MTTLQGLLPAPKVPSSSPTASGWSGLEARLQATLPADFKDFVRVYGAGEICQFLLITSPISENPAGNLAVQMDSNLSILREIRALGMPMPYPVFPEPNGLLPFAATRNGDVLCWLANRDSRPATWPTVVLGSATEDHFRHDGDFSSLLVKLLDHTLELPFFPPMVFAVPRFAPLGLAFRIAGLDQDGSEGEGVQGLGLRLLRAAADLGSPVPAFVGVPLEPDDVRATFAQKSLDPPQELVELYAWQNGIDQARWQVFARREQAADLEFVARTWFTSLKDAEQRYSFSLRERVWPADCWPAFLQSERVLGVVCHGGRTGQVVSIGPDGASEEVASSIKDLFAAWIRELRTGRWVWNKQRRRFDL